MGAYLFYLSLAFLKYFYGPMAKLRSRQLKAKKICGTGKGHIAVRTLNEGIKQNQLIVQAEKITIWNKA